MRCFSSPTIPDAHRWHILSDLGTAGLAHDPSSLERQGQPIRNRRWPFIYAAETRISNNERACLCTGRTNHLAYVQHLDFLEGHVLGQMSRPSQTESRCWIKCCRNAGTSMMSMSSARMPNSYPVPRTDLNMDHA